MCAMKYIGMLAASDKKVIAAMQILANFGVKAVLKYLKNEILILNPHFHNQAPSNSQKT